MPGTRVHLPVDFEVVVGRRVVTDSNRPPPRGVRLARVALVAELGGTLDAGAVLTPDSR